MDRSIDRAIAERSVEKEQAVRQEPSTQPREAPEKPVAGRKRSAAMGRFRTCRMSEAEQKTLYDIGRFRTVAVQDLTSHKYKGKAGPMEQDLRSLAEQGLLRRRTVWLNKHQGKLAVVVLTRAGKDLLERARPGPAGQAVYSGFVKPAEVAHDAAIYRMFHKEGALIEKAGGQIRRVVLDYELKKKIYSPLAKAKGLPPLEYAKRQAEVGQENGLKVVKGKIPLPDLRIEYETAGGELARVDLELATHHYHGSHLATKAAAGFKMYAADELCQRSAPFDDREITAEIFSL